MFLCFKTGPAEISLNEIVAWKSKTVKNGKERSDGDQPFAETNEKW